jgi:hypothetical protein
MRVYIWPTFKSKNFVGHAAIQIADQYFSFYSNDTSSSGYERWNTATQDEEGLGKAHEIIDINVDGIFYPYILDLYNPSIIKHSVLSNRRRICSYRGMGGLPYNLAVNNCCHQVANFINVAITPYLTDIFGNPKENTYWLNYQNEQYSQARYEKLKSLYYKYNTGSDVKEANAILCNWVLYKLYKMAILHKYGSHVAEQIIIKDYRGLTKQPDCIIWNTDNIIYYARFAKSVVEDLSGKVPAIPWIYTVEWKNSNGEAKPRDVSELNNFQRNDLGFENFNGELKRLGKDRIENLKLETLETLPFTLEILAFSLRSWLF